MGFLYAIQAIMFTCVLVHNLRGSRLKSVTIMASLLLASSVISVSNLFFDPSKSLFYGQLEYYLLCMFLLCFAEAHWILAMIYYDLSTQTKNIEEEEPIETSSRWSCLNVTGITVCALIPLAYAYFNAHALRL